MTKDVAPGPPEDAPPGNVTVRRSNGDEVAHVLIDERFELEIDEPVWTRIGNYEAPQPADYLLVAVAGCQVEVLAQCMHKARIDEYTISIEAERSRFDTGDGGPNPYPDHTSWRVREVSLDLTVETTEEYAERVESCLKRAEEACIISRSVEEGIDIDIRKQLKTE